MKTLVLHIGMHKTGTSSIQQTFHGNREILLAHGINYLNTEKANHSESLFSLFTSTPHKYHINIRLGVNTPERAREHNDRLRRALEAECRNNSSRHFVICAEDLGWLSVDEVAALKRFFEPYFDRVRVIAYVRPPASYLNSVVQELIKNGTRIRRASDVGRGLRYRSRFEPFLTIFGADAVTLALYARDRFKRHCVVAEFLTMLGAPDDLYDQLVVARANESVSATAAKLLNAANEVVPVFKSDELNPARAPDLKRVLARLPGPRLVLPARWIRQAVENTREDIAWLEGLLETSLSAEDLAVDETATEQMFTELDEQELRTIAAFVNDLLRSHARIITEVRAHHLVLLGQSEARHGDTEAAIEHFRAAVAVNPEHAGAFRALSRLHMLLGQLDQALDAAKHAAALKPDNQEYQQWLEGVEARRLKAS